MRPLWTSWWGYHWTSCRLMAGFWPSMVRGPWMKWMISCEESSWGTRGNERLMDWSRLGDGLRLSRKRDFWSRWLSSTCFIHLLSLSSLDWRRLRRMGYKSILSTLNSWCQVHMLTHSWSTWSPYLIHRSKTWILALWPPCRISGKVEKKQFRCRTSSSQPFPCEASWRDSLKTVNMRSCRFNKWPTIHEVLLC